MFTYRHKRCYRKEYDDLLSERPPKIRKLDGGNWKHDDGTGRSHRRHDHGHRRRREERNVTVAEERLRLTLRGPTLSRADFYNTLTQDARLNLQSYLRHFSLLIKGNLASEILELISNLENIEIDKMPHYAKQAADELSKIERLLTANNGSIAPIRQVFKEVLPAAQLIALEKHGVAFLDPMTHSQISPGSTRSIMVFSYNNNISHSSAFLRYSPSLATIVAAIPRMLSRRKAFLANKVFVDHKAMEQRDEREQKTLEHRDAVFENEEWYKEYVKSQGTETNKILLRVRVAKGVKHKQIASAAKALAAAEGASKATVSEALKMLDKCVPAEASQQQMLDKRKEDEDMAFDGNDVLAAADLDRFVDVGDDIGGSKEEVDITPGSLCWLSAMPSAALPIIPRHVLAEMGIGNVGHNILQAALAMNGHQIAQSDVSAYQNLSARPYLANHLWTEMSNYYTPLQDDTNAALNMGLLASCERVNGLINIPIPSPLCPLECLVLEVDRGTALVEVKMPVELADQWFSTDISDRSCCKTLPLPQSDDVAEVIGMAKHHIMTQTRWPLKSPKDTNWLLVAGPQVLMSQRTLTALRTIATEKFTGSDAVRHIICRMEGLPLLDPDAPVRALKRVLGLNSSGYHVPGQGCEEVLEQLQRHAQGNMVLAAIGAPTAEDYHVKRKYVPNGAEAQWKHLRSLVMNPRVLEPIAEQLRADEVGGFARLSSLIEPSARLERNAPDVRMDQILCARIRKLEFEKDSYMITDDIPQTREDEQSKENEENDISQTEGDEDDDKNEEDEYEEYDEDDEYEEYDEDDEYEDDEEDDGSLTEEDEEDQEYGLWQTYEDEDEDEFQSKDDEEDVVSQTDADDVESAVPLTKTGRFYFRRMIPGTEIDTASIAPYRLHSASSCAFVTRTTNALLTKQIRMSSFTYQDDINEFLKPYKAANEPPKLNAMEDRSTSTKEQPHVHPQANHTSSASQSDIYKLLQASKRFLDESATLQYDSPLETCKKMLAEIATPQTNVKDDRFPTDSFPTEEQRCMHPQANHNPLSHGELELAKRILDQLPQLNPSQRKAIMLAFNQTLTLIQGPPGTGKTSTITTLVWLWVCAMGVPLMFRYKHLPNPEDYLASLPSSTLTEPELYEAGDFAPSPYAEVEGFVRETLTNTDAIDNALTPSPTPTRLDARAFAFHQSVNSATVDLRTKPTQPPAPPKPSSELLQPLNVSGRGPVLVSAFTNVAIDEICARLLQMPGFIWNTAEGVDSKKRKPHFTIVRLGNSKKVDPRVEHARLSWHLLHDEEYQAELCRYNEEMVKVEESMSAAKAMEVYLKSLLECARKKAIRQMKQSQGVSKSRIPDKEVDNERVELLHPDEVRNNMSSYNPQLISTNMRISMLSAIRQRKQSQGVSKSRIPDEEVDNERVELLHPDEVRNNMDILMLTPLPQLLSPNSIRFYQRRISEVFGKWYGNRKKLNKELAAARMRAEDRIMAAASVVIGTCMGAGSKMLDNSRFSLVVIDECSQVPEPACLVPISRLAPCAPTDFTGDVSTHSAVWQKILDNQRYQTPETLAKFGFAPSVRSPGSFSRVVLVGDQCQLPPVVESELMKLAGVHLSLFERLMVSAPHASTSLFFGSPYVTNDPQRTLVNYPRLAPRTALLLTQYRMNPVLASWISKHVYSSRITSGTHAGHRKCPPGFPWPLAIEYETESVQNPKNVTSNEAASEADPLTRAILSHYLAFDTFTNRWTQNASAEHLATNLLSAVRSSPWFNQLLWSKIPHKSLQMTPADSGNEPADNHLFSECWCGGIIPSPTPHTHKLSLTQELANYAAKCMQGESCGTLRGTRVRYATGSGATVMRQYPIVFIDVPHHENGDGMDASKSNTHEAQLAAHVAASLIGALPSLEVLLYRHLNDIMDEAVKSTNRQRSPKDEGSVEVPSQLLHDLTLRTETSQLSSERVVTSADGRNLHQFVARTWLAEAVTRSQGPRVSASELGIVTPYVGQVREVLNSLAQVKNMCLRNKWHDKDISKIDVKSVDGFQGREKEVIIMTCVRSNAHKSIGFLADMRRLNVAVSRAKRGLIMIGNRETLRNHPLWASYIEAVEKCGAVVSYDTLAPWLMAGVALPDFISA